MKLLIAAVVVFALTTGQASASPKDDVKAHVKRFMDHFNKGDIKAATADCVDDMSIVDELPPYEWHGPGAFGKWLNDFGVDAAKRGITDSKVTLGKCRFAEVSGDRAYTVYTVDYSYKQKGKPTKQTGASFTASLLKTKSGWRITGWTWTKP